MLVWICVQLVWIYTQLILVEDNFLQYIYNFAVRSTTFSFIYLTSNKICTTCLSNKPLIDLFTQLLTCRHQGCFAIYDVLFTCLTYAVFITHLLSTRLSIVWVQLTLWNVELLPHFRPACYRFQLIVTIDWFQQIPTFFARLIEKENGSKSYFHSPIFAVWNGKPSFNCYPCSGGKPKSCEYLGLFDSLY